MRIRWIALKAFRNLATARLEFDQPRTVILGANGQGKTNLLEAVHLLCVTRSFRRARNEHFVSRGEKEFSVSAEFETDLRGRRRARLIGGRGGLKFELDSEAIRGLASYFGQLPVVVLSPEQAIVTQGGPDQRRRFLDRLISAQSPVYLETLLRYQRSLKQRNVLLLRTDLKDAQFDSWENELVRTGLELCQRRRDFLADLNPLFKEIYNQDLAQELAVEVLYKRSLREDLDHEGLLKELQDRRLRDRQRGGTGIGPHRDDLEFRLNEQSLRDFGSQGQHKLFLLALILAESRILHQRTGELPLLLLDDLFGVLDDERIQMIGKLTDKRSQLLVTTTSERHLEILGRQDTQVVFMKDGVIQHG